MVTEDGWDVVSGWKQHRQDNKLTKNLPSKLYNATARWITGIRLHDMNCGLKAYKNEVIKDIEVYGEIKHAGKNLYRSMHKAVEVPGLAADALHGLMKGQTRVNLDLHASNDLAQLLRRLVRNVVMGLWVMALLISSSIICTTNMSPKICGIPAIGAIGYLFAFAIVMYVLIKHILSK